MNYLSAINNIYIQELKKKKDWIIYGQNLFSGSYITGLSKNINKIKKSRIINTTNSEYTAIGMGFGVMINGGHAVYFVKQLDFLLLGVDHFVNTLNHIKTQNSLIREKLGSFVIITYVCDHGWHGSQSSFNNIDDLSSLAQINSYQINTEFEAQKIIPSVFDKKEFSIISLGQRLVKKDITIEKANSFSKNYSAFAYYDSDDVLIISCNFAFDYALQIRKKINSKFGIYKVGIININFINDIDINFILKRINYQKKIILISDTKSINSRIFSFIPLIKKKFKKNIHIIKRENFDWKIQEDLFDFEFNLKNL
jgi:pyruvate/2-oxoglutarate/acetoin dehydrogenase E1 component